MTATIRIRAYQPDDLDSLINLFTDTVRRVAGRDYTEAQTAAWAPTAVSRAKWSQRLAGRPTFVAEIGPAIVGFSDLEPDGHIDMMFVHADHQGQGVASRLMDHIEGMAAEFGLAALFTESSITARPFFERRGFHVVESQDVEVRGQILRNYRMRRTL